MAREPRLSVLLRITVSALPAQICKDEFTQGTGGRGKSRTRVRWVGAGLFELSAEWQTGILKGNPLSVSSNRNG